MNDGRVWVFFYGLFMDFEILRRYGLEPERWQVAKLPGYDIRIAARGNLVPSDRHSVYGLLVAATHEALARLYDKSNSTLTTQYFPEAVLVEAADGGWVPALCYVAPPADGGGVNADYVNGLVELAQRFGFPRWYVERLESFRK
ncbi:MAG: gamma-glutamylcyclotransferase [Acidobacteriota bacterium]|nr:gamma-glutamylcyclotransferase [Acidobacteriota bacterium]